METRSQLSFHCHSREMKSQEFGEFQREGETHERDHEGCDQYSSSESCCNISTSVPKRNRIRKVKAVSSMANRKTSRTNMQQKYEELSSIVPEINLKDENSVIDDTISYLKLLQERAYILEEEKRNLHVEKAWVSCDKYIGQSFSSSVYQHKQTLPEIDAKVQGNDVLIRVHCENQKGYLSKVLEEIEKLHLDVVNINAVPFGNYYLDITVMAQTSDESITSKDLKRNLTEASQLFM